MAVNQEFNVLQGVQYDPRYDDQSFSMVADAMAKRNDQYNAAKAGMLDAQAGMQSEAALYARDPDKAALAQHLDSVNQIPDFVNQKYNGDYAAARFDISKQMLDKKKYFDQAKQAYDAEQKVAPMYAQLEAQKKLILPGGIDPRKQSIFNDKGEYAGTPNYNPLERSDYDKVINEGLVQGIDKISKEYGLTEDKAHLLLASVTRGGLDAIPDKEIRNKIKSYTSQFLGQTTFNEDPTLAAYHDNPEQFIHDSVLRQAGRKTGVSYMEDYLGRQQAKAKKEAEFDPYNSNTHQDNVSGISTINKADDLYNKAVNSKTIFDKDGNFVVPTDPIMKSNPTMDTKTLLTNLALNPLGATNLLKGDTGDEKERNRVEVLKNTQDYLKEQVKLHPELNMPGMTPQAALGFLSKFEKTHSAEIHNLHDFTLPNSDLGIRRQLKNQISTNGITAPDLGASGVGDDKASLIKKLGYKDEPEFQKQITSSDNATPSIDYTKEGGRMVVPVYDKNNKKMTNVYFDGNDVQKVYLRKGNQLVKNYLDSKDHSDEPIALNDGTYLRVKGSHNIINPAASTKIVVHSYNNGTADKPNWVDINKTTMQEALKLFTKGIDMNVDATGNNPSTKKIDVNPNGVN